MDQERQRIQDDLRGRIEGEVRCDDVFVRMYASDASIYEVEPMGVVRPRNTADVVACVQYAAEHELSVHPRGAGSGLAGGCLGRGLVLDFSHGMRQILSVSEDSVRVQAGIGLDQLNHKLGRDDRHFGPGPRPPSISTVGSLISVDRKGSRWLRYGSTRDRVLALQVVMADGTILELKPESLQDRKATSTPRLGTLTRQVAKLITDHRALIDSSRPASLVDSSGYALHSTLDGDKINLAKLIAGSEGTLALITEATVATNPRPQHTGVALLMFDRLEKAARAANEVRSLGVTSCDLLDRRLLSLARETDIQYDVVLPPTVEAVLLVEAEGDDISEVRQRLQNVTQVVRRRKRLAFDARIALEPIDVALYLGLAGRVIQMLYRLEGTQRPLPFVEDIAVPPEVLADFLVRAQNVLKRHHVTASLFAHAGHGQLHIRPFLDLADTDDVTRMKSVAEDLYEEVQEVDGTISGEHGEGLSRSWHLRRRAGPLFKVLREVKRIFDPHNTLNPGKVADETPQPLTFHLRPVTEAASMNHSANGSLATAADAAAVTGETQPLPQPLDLQLAWVDGGIEQAARLCNGCGGCRTQAATVRMCPIFRLAPAEESSPRAKANIVRGLLTGRIGMTELDSEDLKQVADLCVNCHQCRNECPAGVDIPKLVVETKAQYVASNGISFSDWSLSQLDVVARWARSIVPLANFAIRHRRARWLLEKVFGIAQSRKLPLLASRTFISRAQRLRLTRPTAGGGLKVLYFTDVYANLFDVELAEAMVAVFEHNGINVFVHPDQVQAGMALITLGAVNRAKKLAEKNIAILADAVRQGYHIVTTEPAAALCLTHEYLHLVDDDDSRLVAANSSEACSYLWRMHQQGRMELDLRPINLTIGYHQPCHVRALNVGSPGENLLRLIPGISVRTIDKGCSGMAGTYGLKRENFRGSVRAGWPLISAMREPFLQAGSTECSACKIQMEQGTAKPTVHPLKVLALAYGLMPELSSLLTRRSGELTVT